MAHIKINDVDPRRQYTAGAGQTTFAFPFIFFEDSHLSVSLKDATTSVVSKPAFTTTGKDNVLGGSIILSTAANINDIITIDRILTIEQTTLYPTAGDFSPETVNAQMARHIMMMQQLQSTLNNRAFLLASDVQTDNLNLELPEPVAGKFWRWDPTGLFIQYVDLVETDPTGVSLADLGSTASGLGASLVGVEKVATARSVQDEMPAIRIALIIDSLGGTPSTEHWANILEELMQDTGVNATVISCGAGGMSYLSAVSSTIPPSRLTYPDLYGSGITSVDYAIASKPDIVMVQLGGNDLQNSDGSYPVPGDISGVQTDVQNFYTALRAGLPDALLVNVYTLAYDRGNFATPLTTVKNKALPPFLQGIGSDYTAPKDYALLGEGTCRSLETIEENAPLVSRQFANDWETLNTWINANVSEVDAGVEVNYFETIRMGFIVPDGIHTEGTRAAYQINALRYFEVLQDTAAITTAFPALLALINHPVPEHITPNLLFLDGFKASGDGWIEKNPQTVGEAKSPWGTAPDGRLVYWHRFLAKSSIPFGISEHYFHEYRNLIDFSNRTIAIAQTNELFVFRVRNTQPQTQLFYKLWLTSGAEPVKSVSGDPDPYFPTTLFTSNSGDVVFLLHAHDLLRTDGGVAPNYTLQPIEAGTYTMKVRVGEIDKATDVLGPFTITAIGDHYIEMLVSPSGLEPSVPAADRARIWLDGGGAKLILKVRFTTGASQTIATEP